MVFEIPSPAGKLKRNRFEFKLGGEIRSLPKIDYVPAEADDYLKAMRGKSVAQREFVLGFIGACDPEIEAKMRELKLTRDQVDALYEAWGKASRVTAGESSDSSTS
ncbi:hypothetical protein IU501_10925 [Nocardia otitidiscaviarum]|uniref:hypothetical protein n=1 Tax=Nocardia otitidiscaviarum TaxID=1823 RepID=UPI0018941E86|nr:hypothetical protein [Nocardia otitidiscaviarum]MBF6133512.1 hypothetical protein [Nocardia otitidiscaviarum]